MTVMDSKAISGNPQKLKKKSHFFEFWRRFKKRKISVAGLAIIALMFLIIIFADFIAPYSYSKIDLSNKLQFPSWKHPFGTDNMGRDILTRCIYGGRVSFLVAVVAIGIAFVIGGFLGATAGYYGRWYESIVMRITDSVMAVPQLMYAVAISAAFDTGVASTAAAIAFGMIPGFVRITRASVLTVRGQEYIMAAKAIGCGSGRIIRKHILKNALSPIIVHATTSMVSTILIISTLSFVGLGVRPPIPEWGNMLSNSREFMRVFWPISIFPGMCIVITLLCFNLVGDGVRDALDPRLKQ
jgi:peptide/nickel transport system permease protein